MGKGLWLEESKRTPLGYVLTSCRSVQASISVREGERGSTGQSLAVNMHVIFIHEFVDQTIDYSSFNTQQNIYELSLF